MFEELVGIKIVKAVTSRREYTEQDLEVYINSKTAVYRDIRIIYPNSMVTMDFCMDRLNVCLDNNYCIERIYSG